MFKTAYDPKRNVVMIELAGKVTVPQMEQLHEELRSLLPQSCAGFKLLTDLTEVYEVDPAITESLKKLMSFLNLKGVVEIFRVIPDPSQDIGLGIMSHFHYSKDVKFSTFKTREEADARL